MDALSGLMVLSLSSNFERSTFVSAISHNLSVKRGEEEEEEETFVTFVKWLCVGVSVQYVRG
ncbi:hypothetical protein HanPSC8_Chr04g0152141 [Helianthus annuus]|nr:hypothetical protein HanPSC8_Chr04g0152141 [Helianthus annuus]